MLQMVTWLQSALSWEWKLLAVNGLTFNVRKAVHKLHVIVVEWISTKIIGYNILVGRIIDSKRWSTILESKGVFTRQN